MNIFDAHISGSLSVSSSAEISGDLTVLGLLNANVSGTITNAVTAAYAPNYTLTSSFEAFTGSYTTGSFTGSFTGSMRGDGSGLTNIPAASIVGLNLSRIASGGATASISPVGGFRVNTNGEITGSLTVTGNIIGAADFTTLRNLPTLVSASSQLTGSYDQRYILSGSITETTWDNIASKPAGIVSGSVQVELTGTTGYSTFSSSLATADSDLSSSIGSLSSSVATTTSGLSSSIGSLSSSIATTDATQNGRLNAIQTATSSLESFTSSIATTIKNKLNTEGVISGSIQVNITGTTGYSTFSSSLSSSIGSLSGSVAQTTLDISSSLNTFEGDISSSIGLLSSSIATTTSGLSSSIGTVSSSVATTTLGLSSSINSISGAVATTTSNLSSSIGSLSSSVATTDLGIKNRLNAVETSTGSLNSFTSSINTTIDSELDIKNVISGSIQVQLTDTTGYNTFSSSISSSIANLSSSVAVTDLAQNGRLNALEGTSASLNSYTSSNDSRLSGIEVTTGSLNSYTSSAKAKFIAIETATGSLNTFTSSATTRLSSLETASGSIRTDFNSFTSSANGRLSSLETASGSIRSNFNSYTSSNDSRVTAIEISTSSLESFTSSIASTIKTKLNTEGVVSGSSQILITGTTGYSTFSSSISTSIGSLSSSVSSSIGSLSASNATYNNTQDNRMGSLEIATGSLNTFTSSIATTIKNKLNTESVISGSIQVDVTQTTNYTSFSSSIATTDANQNSRLNSLEGKSGSYATTGSNIFQGNQTITGSLFVSQNLIIGGSSSINFVSQSTLNIGTNIITVNAQNPTTRFGGLAVIDSGSNPQTSGSLVFDSVDNEWIFVHQTVSGAAVTSSTVITGPETIDNIGNETHLTDNRVPKMTNGFHIIDSSITDNGSKVSINSNTEITGTLKVTGTSLVSGSSQIDITATTNYTTFSSSISSSIGALSSSVATTDANQNTRLNALESTTGSLNSATSSALNRLTSIESTTGSLNSYTSSNTTNINAIQTATSSLNSYTSSANTRFGTIESTTGSLNSFTSSASGRLTSLESASSSIRSDFNSYTSSANTRLGSLETASGSIRTDFNSYTSSANGRLDSIESKTGSIASLNNYTGSNNTVIGTLQSTTSSLNSYTSSNTTNINAIHTATSSLNSYTASANTRFGNIETATSSLNTYTSSANTRFGGIETTTGSLNTFTGSANTRLGLLETASGSIRTDFNSYTSSANGRLNSIEGVTGSISSLNTYTGSANTRLGSLETASGSIRTDFNTYTGSANGRLNSLETTTGSLNTAVSGLNTYSASLKSANLLSGSAGVTSAFGSQTANTFYAAPNGSAGNATFRAIVSADIPTLNQNTTGTAANITATSNITLTSLSSLVSVGTITGGTWNATAISDTYISSATNWNTAYNKRISSLGFTSSTVTITLADTTTVTASVPTLNQNTTGTAANITASSNTSLTSLANLATVGTITSGTWNGGAIGNAYLANSSFYVGTTSISLGRASASQTLTGVSIDGNSATVTNGVYTSGDQTIAGVKTFSSNIINSATADWYMYGFGARGASSGQYGMGLKADITDRTLSFHVPNQAAYSSTGAVPKFGWYSNGATELMTLTSATGNLTVTGTIGASNFSGTHSGTSSGTNTGDQTNISGNAATASQLTTSLTGTNATNLIYATVADNDFFRLRVGGDASNSGWVELATADDGTEPIYLRQYTGTFTTVTRTATLLDGSGNTTFPGALSASSFTGGGSGLTSVPSNTALYPTLNQNTTGNANNITAYTINQNLGTSNAPSFAGLTSTSNATLYRDVYVNGGTGGNYGNRILIGTTTASYTLQDTNVRPTFYMTGAYPVITLNQTASNTNHGATIQFASNGNTTGGSTSRQIVVGANGNVDWLDVGFSGGAWGTNSDGNPHNGIAGYSGALSARFFYNGLLINANANAYGSIPSSLSYNLDVRGSAGISSTLTMTGNVTVPLNSSSGYQNANSSAWFRPTDTSGNTHIYNNNSGGIYLDTNANHYFRNVAGTNRLVIDTSGNATLTGVFTENSSLRYKKDIETIKYGLDKVLQMRGVTYVKKDNDVKEIGVIAEEMYEILPDVVLKNEEGIIDSVSYGRITAVLIEAIKDLKQEINEQNLIISDLKRKLD